jgi:rhodanese-related sulfurtransferase
MIVPHPSARPEPASFRFDSIAARNGVPVPEALPVRPIGVNVSSSETATPEAKMQHQPGFLKLVNEARSRIRQCRVEDVVRKIEKGERFHLVDVREDEEWDNGHIRGAVHIGKGVIERDIERKIPDKDAEIVLYCGGGYRSALAADQLQNMGYRNVVSMDGGWRAWNENEFPTEK